MRLSLPKSESRSDPVKEKVLGSSEVTVKQPVRAEFGLLSLT